MTITVNNKKYTLHVEQALRNGVLKEQIDISRIVPGSVWTSKKKRGVVICQTANEYGSDERYRILCAEKGWLMKTFIDSETCNPMTLTEISDYLNKYDYEFYSIMASPI